MGFGFNFKMPNISLPSIGDISVSDPKAAIDKLKSVDVKGIVSGISSGSLGVDNIEQLIGSKMNSVDFESMANAMENGETPDIESINLDFDL